jgi:hypothetical protein
MSLEKAIHVLAHLYSYLSNTKDRRLLNDIRKTKGVQTALCRLFMVKQQFDPIDLYYNLAKYFVHKNELDAYNFILQSLSEHKVGLTDWGLKDWEFYKSLASTSMHFVSKFIKPYIDAIEQYNEAESVTFTSPSSSLEDLTPEVLTEDQQTILTLISDGKFSEAHALYKETSDKNNKFLHKITQSLLKQKTYQYPVIDHIITFMTDVKEDEDEDEIVKDLCQLTQSLVKMLTYDIASRVLSSIPLHEDRLIVRDTLFKHRDSITSSFT